MKKKTVVLTIIAILFPILFLFSQIRVPSYGLWLHDSYTNPNCKDVDLQEQILGCFCPAIAITPLGFPVRWTGYGTCGSGENDTAKNIDIAIGVVIELTLLGSLLVVIKQKHSKTIQ